MIISFILLALEAGDISCRDWKAGITECNPYATNFLETDKKIKSKYRVRNVPIIQKVVPLVQKIQTKRDAGLNRLIHKYINREERIYYSHKKNIKQIKTKKQKKPYTKSKPKKKKVVNKKVVKKQREEKEKRKENPKVNIPVKQYIHENGNIPDTENPKVNIPVKPIDIIAPVVEPNKLIEEIIMPDIVVDAPSQEKNTSQEEILEKPPKEPKKEQEYAKYSVSKGDSLIAIARKFGVDADVIAKANGINGKKFVYVGQKLTIPMSQDLADSISQASYTVQKGDSLTSIAKRFNLKIKQIQKYNKLKKKSIIRIGQKLILPLPHKVAELAAIEEKAKQERLRKARLKKKKERERLARIALKKKKAKKKRLLKASSKRFKRKLRVQATAYTSHRGQTDKTPFLAAWNNRIRPGMKVIAVSRDLIYRYGITNGSKVKISGLKGVYTVRDKMNKKWRKKIDIYMGTDRRRALRWGRRRVILYY